MKRIKSNSVFMSGEHFKANIIHMPIFMIHRICKDSDHDKASSHYVTAYKSLDGTVYLGIPLMVNHGEFLLYILQENSLRIPSGYPERYIDGVSKYCLGRMDY